MVDPKFCPGILRGGKKKNAALAQQKFTLWPCPGRTDLALIKRWSKFTSAEQCGQNPVDPVGQGISPLLHTKR